MCFEMSRGNPPPPVPFRAIVRLEVTGDRVYVDAPAEFVDRDALRSLRPDVMRALAPVLPPRASWPEHMREAWAEREAIAAEGGAPDPTAVADADLRVMIWRGVFDPSPGAKDARRMASCAP